MDSQLAQRPLLLAVLLVVLLVLGWCWAELSTPQIAYFRERPGQLVNAVLSRSEDAAAIQETVHLQSSTGLTVKLRVKRPLQAVDKPLPVFVMATGHKTGKDAVDLVGNSGNEAFVAIDYPYTESHLLRGAWQFIAAIPKFQRSNLDTPPSLTLALSWILNQEWANPAQVELLGVSLGVPFAAVAGATDKRFSRVWLVHGGGDNAAWVAHNLRQMIETRWWRELVAKSLLLMSYGASFDTATWITQIAPRPLVVIVARDDEQVPDAAQLPFIEVAENANVELIWTNGLHIHPKRPDVLHDVLEIIRLQMARDPVDEEPSATALMIRT